MRTSETIEALAKSLAAAQGEMKNAPLNKTNPHFRSRYADLAGVRDAIMPSLAKHKLSIVQGTEITERGAVLCTRLMHESGQWIESVYPLPSVTDNPQALGSALTYARRYSLAAIVGITADEDDDANEAQANAGKPRQQPDPSPFDDQPSGAETYVNACLAIIREERDAAALKQWWNDQKAKRREHQLSPQQVETLKDAVVTRLDLLTTRQPNT